MVVDKGHNTPTFGRIIRERRKALGLTQEELAERVGESVRQSDISRMERDYITLPRRERLKALADALDVTPGYLLMHSGWLTEADHVPFDRPRGTGRGHGLPAEPAGHGATAPDDGGEVRPEPALSTPGAERERARNGRRQPGDSSGITQAGEDVLTANRELTRAIEALTAENQRTRSAGAETPRPSGDGGAGYDELDALNKRLLAIIEGLNTRNDSLEAQSLELIAAAASAEHNRYQLSAVMNAVGDIVIVVDEGQAIVLHSQSFNDLVGNDAHVLRFLNGAGNPLEGNDSPLARVARGESFTESVHIATPRGEVQPYEAVGRPSGVINGHRLGVLTLRLPAA